MKVLGSIVNLSHLLPHVYTALEVQKSEEPYSPGADYKPVEPIASPEFDDWFLFMGP